MSEVPQGKSFLATRYTFQCLRMRRISMCQGHRLEQKSWLHKFQLPDYYNELYHKAMMVTS